SGAVPYSKSSDAIPPRQVVDRSYSAYVGNAPRPSRIPPTQLVDCSYSAYVGNAPRPSRIPPTQLVDCSYPAYKDVDIALPNPEENRGLRLQARYERSNNRVGGIRGRACKPPVVG
ncbi:MAG: hypothetical protein ACRD2L_08040, partial [Terriglobia bacterium]